MMMSLAFGGDCQKPRCLTDVKCAFLQVEEKESRGMSYFLGSHVFAVQTGAFSMLQGV